MAGIILGVLDVPVWAAPASNGCYCVVFALEDVQDYWLHSTQSALMDTFLSSGQKLSVGLVAGHLGNDPLILGKVRDGLAKGAFEPVVAGWHYVDYSTLSRQEQTASLIESNNRLDAVLGVTSEVFLPPAGLANEDTLLAMQRSNMTVLATDAAGRLDSIWNAGYLVTNDISNGDGIRSSTIFHLSTLGYSASSSSAVIDQIKGALQSRGYAVVLIHPQDFATMNPQTHAYDDKVDASALSGLSDTINALKNQGATITSFSELAARLDAEVGTLSPSALAVVGNMTAPPSPSPASYSGSGQTAMTPPDPINTNGMDSYHTLVASVYNNYGRSIYEAGMRDGVSPSALAAIILVESHGQAFGSDGRMTIRFEACTFYGLWGQYHQQEFSDRFQCNSPNDTFRPSPGSAFIPVHSDQRSEWTAFQLARQLDENAAVKSISMGLGQIMGFNYGHIGYDGPQAMLANMSSSAASQLDGLFAGLQHTNSNGISCIEKLRAPDYVAFAACYNGAGRDAAYASQIENALSDYRALTVNRVYSDSISLP